MKNKAAVKISPLSIPIIKVFVKFKFKFGTINVK